MSGLLESPQLPSSSKVFIMADPYMYIEFVRGREPTNCTSGPVKSKNMTFMFRDKYERG